MSKRDCVRRLETAFMIAAAAMLPELFMLQIPVQAQLPPNSIWLEPTYLDLTGRQLGFRFNLTCWIATKESTFMWQVRLNFPDWLDCTNTNYTGYDYYHGLPQSQFFSGQEHTIPSGGFIDNELGNKHVTVAESLLGPDVQPANTDTLFWVEFEIVALPPVHGSLIGAVDSNDIDTFVIDPDLQTIEMAGLGKCDLVFYSNDVAAEHVEASKNVVGQGYACRVTATVANNGLTEETFDTALYAQAQGTMDNMRGYWGLTQSKGTQSMDLSGNGNHADFNSAAGWEWLSAGDLEGWTTISDVSDLQCDGTSLTGKTTGTNPNLDSPGSLVIDASIAKIIHFRMNITDVSTPGVIYFMTAAEPEWGSGKSIFFSPAPNANEWTDYDVDMSSVPKWIGTVTQIRLVPCQTVDTTFSVDWFRVGSSPKWKGAYGAKFDGVDDRFQAPHINFAAHSFAITAWFKANSLSVFPDDEPIISQREANSVDKHLHVVLRGARVHFGFYYDDLTGAVPISVNRWYHVACVYNITSNTKQIYVDGLLDASASGGTAYQGWMGLTEIGYYSGNVDGGVQCFFNGSISDVRVYDRALSLEEVRAVRSSGLCAFIQAVTVPAHSEATVQFTFNSPSWPLEKGNYTLYAYAWPVQGETYLANNAIKGNCIILAMVGDITGPTGWPDGKCDIRDVSTVAKQFGKYVPPAPANCDINDDGKVDIKDVATVARHFGEVDP